MSEGTSMKKPDFSVLLRSGPGESEQWRTMRAPYLLYGEA